MYTCTYTHTITLYGICISVLDMYMYMYMYMCILGELARVNSVHVDVPCTVNLSSHASRMHSGSLMHGIMTHQMYSMSLSHCTSSQGWTSQVSIFCPSCLVQVWPCLSRLGGYCLPATLKLYSVLCTCIFPAVSFLKC